MTAADALKLGVIERVITEWDKENTTFFERLGESIEQKINALMAIPTPELTARRYQRFRGLGVPSDKGAETK